MRSIIRSFWGALLALTLTPPLWAQKPINPHVRITPIKPIPNVNSRTVFINPFSGRTSLYIPPPAGTDQLGVLYRFASPHWHMPPRTYAMPGQSMMSSGYGSSSTPMSYPVYIPVPQAYPAPAPSTAPASSTGISVASLLDAVSLPHSGDRLLWPIGLRIVPPALQTQPLVQQTEVQIVQLAMGVAYGQTDADLLQATLDNIQRLRQYLKDADTRMPSATAAYASRFLNQLEAKVKQLGEGAKIEGAGAKGAGAKAAAY